MTSTITITLSDDPTEPMKFEITGSWNPRQIHAAAALVPKGYRQMLSDLKRSQDKEKGDV